VTNGKLERFRLTMKKRVEEGGATLTRIHSGEESRLYGRISQIDMRAWSFAPVASGATTGRKPYLLCEWDAELESGDIILDAGRAYQCDEVSRPQRFGGPTHCQAALKEVSYGGQSGF
jgi:hypothetical protein